MLQLTKRRKLRRVEIRFDLYETYYPRKRDTGSWLIFVSDLYFGA